MCVSENGIKWYKVVYGGPVVAISMDQPLHSGVPSFWTDPDMMTMMFKSGLCPVDQPDNSKDTTEFHKRHLFLRPKLVRGS